jgi:DNA-binding FadR family transcriptional regulator
MTFASQMRIPSDLPGRNLTQQMLDMLGKAIVRGEYETCDFPTEGELAHRYRVSRSVTREAIKMLTAKGLVTARPRQGTLVQPTSAWNLLDREVLQWMLARPFSLDLLRQFNQLRIAVEPEAAALAARMADLDHHNRLKRRLTEVEIAARSMDGFLQAEIAFHAALLGASGNPFYSQFHNLAEIALRYARRFTNLMPDWSPDATGHIAVYRAVERGDGEAARAATQALIAELMTLLDPENGEVR